MPVYAWSLTVFAGGLLLLGGTYGMDVYCRVMIGEKPWPGQKGPLQWLGAACLGGLILCYIAGLGFELVSLYSHFRLTQGLIRAGFEAGFVTFVPSLIIGGIVYFLVLKIIADIVWCKDD